MLKLSDAEQLPRTAGIYVFHFTNGKKYVGMTTKSVRSRAMHHLCAGRAGRCETPVRRALAKYGAETVSVSVVLNDTDPAALEVETIAALKQDGVLLYNLTAGGDGVSGFSHSLSTRDAMSASAIGSWTSDRHERIAKRWKDPAFHLRMKASLRDCWTPERRARMAAYSRASGMGARSRKLSIPAVLEIVGQLAEGVSCASLGRRYGVTPECVSAIKFGKNWAHVTGIARPSKGP